MFKKNSWIVALLLALSLTALFTGCIDALAPEEEMTYTEVVLGEFNVWGGQVYQRGWGVAGIKFSGVGDKPEAAADKGYKNDDFGKATKLVIEMTDNTHPNGNLDIIWGAEYANGTASGWNQTGSIPYKKDGNVITIDLTKMKGYAKYKDKTATKRKIVLQAGAEKADLPFVKKATLLIPDKVPFVPVTGLSLATSKLFWTSELALEGVFTPEDATNQIVNWSIKSWTNAAGTTTLSLPKYPEGQGTDSTKPDYNANYTTELAAYTAAKTALLAKVNFKAKTLVIRDEIKEEKQGDVVVWDWTVQPPQKITITGDGQVLVPAQPGQTYAWHEDNVIVATDEYNSLGTVVLIATVVNGVSDPVGEEGKAGYVAGKNFVKELTITIADPPPFKIKVNGVDQTVQFYSPKDNGDLGSTMTANADQKGYTVDLKGSYSNALYYFKVDFGTDTFADYIDQTSMAKSGGVKFKFNGVAGDFKYKDHIRVKALNTPFPGGYGPGQFVSWVRNAADGKGTEEGKNRVYDAKFGWNQQAGTPAGSTPDTTTNINLTNLSDKNVLYFCIYLNCDKVSFSITEIEFYKKTP